MSFLCIKADSMPDAYHKTLQEVWNNGTIQEVPDYKTRMIEAPVIIDISNPILEPRISKMVICGPHELMQYELEILDGILDKRVGCGWDYTYHQRFTDQLQLLIEEFKRNPDTRRGILQIRDWQVDFKTSDPACLQLLNYEIRNNKLNCTAYMRSNDLYNATFMNMWAFIRLQEKIVKMLIQEGFESLEIGRYTHIANSLHVYEKDWIKLKANLAAMESRQTNNESLCYNYQDSWKELMDAEIPKIFEKVTQLTEDL